MKTTHIAAFTTAVAERRSAADDGLVRRADELDEARETLARTDETIRAYEHELERLRAFRTLGIEHVQELEVELDRQRQYREGCERILIDATPPTPTEPAESPKATGAGPTPRPALNKGNGAAPLQAANS